MRALWTKAALAALLMSIIFRSLAFVFAKLAAMATANSGIAYILLNPWYWAELLALAGQTVFWIIALRSIPLSAAYPAMSAVYALNLAWAALMFGEAVTRVHILGIAIIIAGILIAIPGKANSPPA
jgi:multidrug transporter EmrE-like cation transporter